MDHAQAIGTHAAERYLLEEMTELERHAFEAHYFECETCADEVRTGALMSEGVRAGFTGDAAEPAASQPSAVVAAFRPRLRWSPSVVLPWAAAATLALATGYQALWTVPELRRQVMAPQALSPIPLRPATRGAEVTVARPEADGPVTLAIEVAAIAPGVGLTYDLRTAGGQVAASGAALAPSPGAPLLLLIPASSLVGTGSYELSIRAAEGEPAVLSYRFTISDQ
jgi:hypothetical protein